jgi:hypothetical protein
MTIAKTVRDRWPESSSLVGGAGVALDVALGQGGVVGPDGVGDLAGEDLDGAVRLLAGPSAVEVGEHGAAGVARCGDADEAVGRFDPAAARLGGHLDVEHALVVGRVQAVVHRPPRPLLQARDAHHAACTHTGAHGHELIVSNGISFL